MCVCTHCMKYCTREARVSEGKAECNICGILVKAFEIIFCTTLLTNIHSHVQFCCYLLRVMCTYYISCCLSLCCNAHITHASHTVYRLFYSFSWGSNDACKHLFLYILIPWVLHSLVSVPDPPTHSWNEHFRNELLQATLKTTNTVEFTFECWHGYQWKIWLCCRPSCDWSILS